MRFILAFLLYFVTTVAFGQHEIVWKEKSPLAWSDFKGPLRNNSKLAAETYCSINAAVAVKGDQLTVTVQAVFYPDSSWYNQDKIHDLTLLHEQGHFHIAELYARKLRKAVKEKIITFEDYQAHFEKLYEELHKEYFEMQVQYDDETIHGTIRRMQEEWVELIADELEELQSFRQ